MSTQSAIPRGETYREKAARKFKQEPLVPLGALATTVALIIAANKLRKGESRSLNTWLRVRIVAQGLTIAAVVAGTYSYGKKTEPEPLPAPHEVRISSDARGFEERLRAAEEAHAFETGQAPPPPVVVTAHEAKTAEPRPAAGAGGAWYSWSRWVGGGNAKEGDEKPKPPS